MTTIAKLAAALVADPRRETAEAFVAVSATVALVKASRDPGGALERQRRIDRQKERDFQKWSHFINTGEEA